MYHFRPMLMSDISAVLQIEQYAHITPWSEKGFQSAIQSGQKAWLLCHEFEVLGYIVFMEVLKEEVHILNICVKPEWHGKGLGTLIMKEVIQYGLAHSFDAILLEVRPSNLGARALYDKLGFQQIAVRKAYYRTAYGREDALVLQKSLGTT